MQIASPKQDQYPFFERLLREASDCLRDASADPDSHAKAYAALSTEQRSAYVLGCLVYQVNNGGFQQWAGNGYGLRLLETREAVMAVGTAHSAVVAEMLNALAPFLELKADYRGGYWKSEELDADEEERAFFDERVPRRAMEIAEKSDTAFYRICEDWKLDIEVWLKAGAPDRSVGLPASSRHPRYPWISVQLTGQNRNAFNLLGLVRRGLNDAGVSKEELAQFQREATSGNYDHLLQTCVRWVNVK